MRSLRLWGIVSLLLLFASPVWADAARAKEHFQRGTTLFDLGKYRDAAAEYEKAYEEKSDPALLFNIAQAYRLAGETETAIRFYRTFLNKVPRTTNRAVVESRIEELQAALAQQKKAMEGPPEGTIKPSEPARPAEPGPAAAPEVAPAPVAVAPPADLHPGRTKRIAGIAVGAVGVVGVVLGGVLVGLAKQANDDIAPNNVFDPAAESRRDGAQIGSAVCFAVGGAALVTGVVLYVIGHREGRTHATALTPTGRGGALTLSF